MTSAEWLATAREQESLLAELVGTYHPASWSETDPPSMEITARDAEAACGLIREQIRAADKGATSPVTRLQLALAAGDVDSAMSLLSSAWFGVPESRSCWSIRGFREAVALLEDPPEEDAPEADDAR